MGTQDSLDVLISMAGGTSYVKEFMEEVEEEEEEEEGGGDIVAVKKRRLSVQQVRSLEKNFEMENKLEPHTKMQLAKELGLQPRQVAVWFQNRRARWKTKQLEKEYGLLKLNYDSLKTSFEDMKRDTNKLAVELASLKRKWDEIGKQKAELSGQNNGKEDNNSIVAVEDSKHGSGARISEQQGGVLENNGVLVFNEKFEGSESDSSAILNDHVIVITGNNSPRPIDSHISSLRHSTIYVKRSDDTYKSNDIKIREEGLMEALRCTKQSSNSNHIPSKVAGVADNEQQCSFKNDDNEESCNFFNVDDPAAATLPWWEWA